MWFFFIILIILITYYAGSYSAAPWIPCRSKDVSRILKIASIKPGDRVYEIGCGDGRTLFAAAKLGAIAAGCEISLLPFLIAKTRLLFTRGKKPKIEYKNLWNVPLDSYDVIIVFLMPRIMEKLQAKLEKELKPGTRVVSYVFKIPGWTPIAVEKPENRLPVYLYVPKNQQE